MSFVTALPEAVIAAASDLANIGSTISQANAAALTPTTSLLAAGTDEVSAAIAAVFATHTQSYQGLSAQATAFHEQFARLMSAGAGQYALAEAAAATPLQNLEQQLLNIINTPTNLLLGRPLIGNGANGAPGVDGQAGGLLIGNGGAGGAGTAAHPAGGNGEPPDCSAMAGPADPAGPTPLGPLAGTAEPADC